MIKSVTLAALILAFFTFSMAINCSKKQASSPPTVPKARIVAVYLDKDSTRKLDVLLRVIAKKIEFDSIKRRDLIKLDTFWGVLRKVDTARNSPPVYVEIGKDSVNWRIESRDVDSLLKGKGQ